MASMASTLVPSLNSSLYCFSRSDCLLVLNVYSSSMIHTELSSCHRSVPKERGQEPKGESLKEVQCWWTGYEPINKLQPKKIIVT